MDIKLYEFGSSRSIRCQWLLKELNLPYESVEDRSLFRSDELKKIHPLGKMPAAVIDGKPLFENASAVIPNGHKVGIVGRNGSGKTTLFRLIRDELEVDGGQIELPANFRIGGVDQEAPASDISLLDTVLAADHERHQLLAEADTATDADRLGQIHARLIDCLLYTSPSPRDLSTSRMPSSA